MGSPSSRLAVWEASVRMRRRPPVRAGMRSGTRRRHYGAGSATFGKDVVDPAALPLQSRSGSRAGPACSIVLKLIDLVVERLETDPQLARRGRLVAVVFLEDRLDVLHLDVAERRVALGDLEVGPAQR